MATVDSKCAEPETGAPSMETQKGSSCSTPSFKKNKLPSDLLKRKKNITPRCERRTWGSEPQLLLRMLQMILLDEVSRVAKSSKPHEIAHVLHLEEGSNHVTSWLKVRPRVGHVPRQRGDLTLAFLCGGLDAVCGEAMSLVSGENAVVLIAKDDCGKWLVCAMGHATASWGERCQWKVLTKRKNEDRIIIPLKVIWPGAPQDGDVEIDMAEAIKCIYD